MGTATPSGAVFTGGTGALYVAAGGTVEAGSSSGQGLLGFNAARSSSLYKVDIQTVQPQSNQVLIVIKT